MNTILLEPIDVLFFRDGRPMNGASSGHGAAWPLPTVVNLAFHAALHRAGFDGVHHHRRGRAGKHTDARDRKFGSLVTAGPFLVHVEGEKRVWYFPRPADAADPGEVTLRPVRGTGVSSLAAPCVYPVVSNRPPSKEAAKPWWNRAAWDAYLGVSQPDGRAGVPLCKTDAEFADTEHGYGIGLDPATGSVKEGMFYSAHYLRLRPDWRLGVLATAPDKDYSHPEHGNDLVRALLDGGGTRIIAGGQQRVCTAVLAEQSNGRPPLPRGRTSGFEQHDGKWLVKWALLTPAIFPEITARTASDATERKAHPGGWLPSWICPESGNVLLQLVSAEERRRRRSLNAAGKGYESRPDIDARLVAAVVPKPAPVTGWALPNGTDRSKGGAKATHLAVPAGAVYYFEAGSVEDAEKLAAALNWHGGDPASGVIRNRRSALLGEKGFGLGVCGTWNFHGVSGAKS